MIISLGVFFTSGRKYYRVRRFPVSFPFSLAETEWYRPQGPRNVLGDEKINNKANTGDDLLVEDAKKQTVRFFSVLPPLLALPPCPFLPPSTFFLFSRLLLTSLLPSSYRPKPPSTRSSPLYQKQPSTGSNPVHSLFPPFRLSSTFAPPLVHTPSSFLSVLLCGFYSVCFLFSLVVFFSHSRNLTPLNGRRTRCDVRECDSEALKPPRLCKRSKQREKGRETKSTSFRSSYAAAFASNRRIRHMR
jgi:hypothetical protein